MSKEQVSKKTKEAVRKAASFLVESFGMTHSQALLEIIYHAENELDSRIRNGDTSVAFANEKET